MRLMLALHMRRHFFKDDHALFIMALAAANDDERALVTVPARRRFAGVLARRIR